MPGNDAIVGVDKNRIDEAKPFDRCCYLADLPLRMGARLPIVWLKAVDLHWDGTLKTHHWGLCCRVFKNFGIHLNNLIWG